MARRSIITSGRFLACLSAIIVLASCSDSTDEIAKVNRGPSLAFTHWPAEQIVIVDDRDLPVSYELSCADLHFFVTSEFRKPIASNTLSPYHIESDESIEQQVRDYLDPTGKQYNGLAGYIIIIEYVTAGCKRIRITMYDKDENFISDITDQACFYYVWSTSEGKEYNLLFDTSKKLIGNIPIGMTIQEYLVQDPMVFSQARFIFPEIEKAALENGNYLVVEIELDDGRILMADQRQFRRPSEEPNLAQ